MASPACLLCSPLLYFILTSLWEMFDSKVSAKVGGKKSNICPNPRAVNGRCFMITCLQSTTETSSSRTRWLILTLSYRRRITGRQSHLSKRSLIWWFKGRVPIWIAKQERDHTDKKRRPQRGHSAELAPTTRHTEFSFPARWKYRWGSCCRRGSAQRRRHGQLSTHTAANWTDASLKRRKRRIREWRQIPRCSCPSWWSFGTKFLLAPSVLRPTVRMVWKRWLLMWR